MDIKDFLTQSAYLSSSNIFAGRISKISKQESFIKKNILNRVSEAFNQHSVSNDETGENTAVSQKKFSFSRHTRIWVVYILFNVGLYLPGIIFKVGDAATFQLNLEVTALFAIWAIFGDRWRKRYSKKFAAGFGLFYVVGLLYKIYASAISGLYFVQPTFFIDYSFISGNISFLFEAMNPPLWIYLSGGIAIIALIALIFWGTRPTFGVESFSAPGRTARSELITLGLTVAVVGVLFPNRTASLQLPLSSVTNEIVTNIQRSIEAREKLNTFLTIEPGGTYDYAQYPLSETPDVFFVFIESYGSVLYKRPHFTPTYLEMLAGMEKNLALDGWSAVSTLSEAPVWGGGSWMSYASALFGLSIENQAEYDAFKKKYSETEYPNMGRYFSSQGYEYVWVKPINRRLPENREAIDKLFYGPDRWITFNTLDYQGPMLGWGPSVPDQFTFGFIQEFASEQPQPTFLVFLTQNLHYPWTPLPPLVDEWQALENIDSEWIEAQDKGLSWNENYLQAVNHTFVSLEAFITSLEEKNSVIVLIGDHQPPAVSRHDDGFGTMVHIISQDIDLLDSFEEFGFVNGWVLENTRPVIRHEGFYSLFIRNFVAQYGENPWNTPPYLPNGSQ